MATATEIITDWITLRYNGNFSQYQYSISNNRISGAVYTNPIYQVPAGKIAEVIVHIWRNDTDGGAYLGRLMMGYIREGVTNGHADLRYTQDFNYDTGLGTEGLLDQNTRVNGSYALTAPANANLVPKDSRFILDENMYIFRESGAAANFGPESGIGLWWDMTVILRNKP